ncbi:acyl-CoA dehydrogenase family protein [Candidatus Binatus sp.]|uniref:acyl-CoA dehydrogenase family protein n=1 Tax=Candidatus Binatus sp. TaxID=2811406 RepID=UPI003C7102A4
MQIEHDEIMRRAAAIAPTLAAHARECDAARMLTAESMASMVNAGMFRIPQPRRVGGYELSLRTLADAVTSLSEACPASGWVLMVMGAHHWCMGSFPEAAQDEVFGDGRDGLVAGTLSSQGVASVVDGGYRVEGRWQFCSGVDHADWVILGCADAVTRRPSVHVVVPRAELEVDDTWQVMGLQGTGSKDVVAHNIFVPLNRAIDTRTLFRGASPHAINHATNLYRLSAEAMLSVSVATAVLGSAKFALRQFIERTRERRVILTGVRKAEHGPTQVRLAEAAAEVHSADLLIHDILAEFDRLTATGASFDNDHRVRAKWQAAYAAELCRRAVARMFSGSGAHAVYTPSALQAAFRNVNVGAQHASIDFDNSAEQYARARLGLGS